MILPLRNNIFILAFDDPDEYRHGSLVLARPDSTKDRADQGLVKAIGPDVRSVQIGDHVIFSPYAGKVVNVTDEGMKVILVSEDGIDGIILPEMTTVSGLYMKEKGYDSLPKYFPATAEAAMQLCREAVMKLPRVVEVRKRWNLARHE